MKLTPFFSWSMVGRGVAAPFSFRRYVPGRSTSPLCNGRQLHVSQPSLSVRVLVELKEWPEAAQIRELQSGALDIGIDHLEELSDRLESMLLLRERFVLVLPKNHPAARKRAVNFKDLRDDLLLIPRRDLFPTVHQMIVGAFVAGGAAPNRTQVVEHVQTAMALVAANAGFAFVPESADRLAPRGVTFRPLNTVVPKFETVVLCLRGSSDPLVRRVLEILKQIRTSPDFQGSRRS